MGSDQQIWLYCMDRTFFFFFLIVNNTYKRKRSDELRDIHLCYLYPNCRPLERKLSIFSIQQANIHRTAPASLYDILSVIQDVFQCDTTGECPSLGEGEWWRLWVFVAWSLGDSSDVIFCLSLLLLLLLLHKARVWFQRLAHPGLTRQAERLWGCRTWPSAATPCLALNASCPPRVALAVW